VSEERQPNVLRGLYVPEQVPRKNCTKLRLVAKIQKSGVEGTEEVILWKRGEGGAVEVVVRKILGKRRGVNDRRAGSLAKEGESGRLAWGADNGGRIMLGKKKKTPPK